MKYLKLGEVYGGELTSQGDAADVFQLTRIYYHHKCSPTFRRTIFYAKSKIKIYYNVVIIIDTFCYFRYAS